MTNEFKGTLFTCPEGSRTSTAVYYVLNHKYDEYMLKLESMIGIDELIKVHAMRNSTLGSSKRIDWRW